MDRPDAFVGVYAAIDREGDIVVLVKGSVDMVLDFVKETVDVVLDVLVPAYQWACRKDWPWIWRYLSTWSVRYRRKAAVRNYWTRLPWGLTVFSDLAVQIKKDYKFYYSSLLRFYKVLLPPFTTFMYYYVYTVPICYHRNSNYLSCIPYLAFTISMFTYACCFIPLHVYPDWQSLSTWRCLQVQAKLVHAEATASIFDMVYFDSIPDLW